MAVASATCPVEYREPPGPHHRSRGACRIRPPTRGVTAAQAPHGTPDEPAAGSRRRASGKSAPGRASPGSRGDRPTHRAAGGRAIWDPAVDRGPGRRRRVSGSRPASLHAGPWTHAGSRALNLVVSSIVRMQPVEERLHAGVSRQAHPAAAFPHRLDGGGVGNQRVLHVPSPGRTSGLPGRADVARTRGAGDTGLGGSLELLLHGVIVPRRRRSQRPPGRSSPDGFARRRRLNSPQRPGGTRTTPAATFGLLCCSLFGGGWAVSGWTASIEVPAGWLAGGGPPRRRAESGRGTDAPEHAVSPSRLRSSTASRTARRARRVSPCSRCRCRSRPAVGVRLTGARASRYRADAKPGSHPAAWSAASTAASRSTPDGISRWALPARGSPTVRGHPRAGRESVLHREEARPFPGLQLRHPDPVLAGEHAAVVRLRVADDGPAAAVPDAVQGVVEHRQPSSVREGLGDVRLGVTHQALELLTRRFDGRDRGRRYVAQRGGCVSPGPASRRCRRGSGSGTSPRSPGRRPRGR